MVHLLGAARGKLYLNSVTTTGTGLSLQHNLRALDLATGDAVWLKPDDGQTGLTTAGRGLLAGDNIYWPTSAGLMVLDQENGEFIAADRRIQGNLAAAEGCLVAAGVKHLRQRPVGEHDASVGIERRDAIRDGFQHGFKLTPAQQFWKIYFPSALPTIFVGIRLGLIFALINVVGVEFLINFGGLGHLINELAERYDLAGTYAAICFVVLVSILFFMATERAERWLTSAA